MELKTGKHAIMQKSYMAFTVLSMMLLLSCNSNNTLIDPQGNVYFTVKIGDQVWINRNFNFAIEDSCFCYDDKKMECDSMGRLYTWKGAVKVDEQIEGWHLPTKQEWEELIEYYGGDSLAYNTIMNQAEGFKPQMAGVRLASGKYVAKKVGVVNYWSSTSSDTSSNHAYSVAFMQNLKKVSPHNYPKINACSVRLIKDY